MQTYPDPRASPMTENPVERPRDVFEIVSEAFSLYGKGFLNLWIPFLIVSIIVGILSAMLTIAVGDIATDIDWENDEEIAEAVIAIVLLSIATLVIGLAGSALATGMVVFTVRDLAENKEPAPLGQIFEKTQPKWPSLIAGSILFAILLICAIAAPIIASIFLLLATGLVFWIVIGIFVGILLGVLCFTWFYIWAVCIVLEDQGVSDSFRRSKQLVQGDGWHVFGLILVSFLVITILGSIVSSLAAFLVPPGAVAARIVVQNAASSVVSPLAGTMTTLLYFDLKARKEMGPARWAPARTVAPAPFSSTGFPPGAEPVFCSECGAAQSPSTTFCSNCGSKIQTAPAPAPAAAPSPGFCSECGTPLPSGTPVSFCPNCGAKVQ